MSQYYYFSASLPMLEPDAPPPMSNEEFLESCERLLTTSDFQEIRRASLNMADPAETRIDLRHLLLVGLVVGDPRDVA